MTSPATKRAAALIRVSTDLQDLDSQRQAVLGWAEREGAEIRWYEEEAVSGAARSRPVLEQMVKDARAGKFRVLVVHALDRVARDVVRLVTTLDEIDHAGVDLVSLREGLDFRGPPGRAMASLLGAIGEIERANIRHRVKAGVAAAKAKGKHVGRPRLEPSEEDVAEVLELREQGLSLRAIAGQVAFFESKGAARSPSPAFLHGLIKERWGKVSPENNGNPRPAKDPAAERARRIARFDRMVADLPDERKLALLSRLEGVISIGGRIRRSPEQELEGDEELREQLRNDPGGALRTLLPAFSAADDERRRHLIALVSSVSRSASKSRSSARPM